MNTIQARPGYGITGLVLATALGLATSVAGAATFKVLHDFDGDHGADPHGGMAIGSDGLLHGTTQVYASIHDHGNRLQGGGTMYQMETTGKAFRSVHYFGKGPQGSWNPLSRLTIDPSGTIYGTTSYGGPDNTGAIYTWDAVNGYQVRLFLPGGSGGREPIAGITRGPDGTLYGATRGGGDAECDCGTVFKVDPATNLVTTLHTFTRTDGAYPEGSLALVGDTLWGTAAEGGPADTGLPYSLKTDGSQFKNYLPDQGSLFYAGLTPDASGNIWGAASEGIYRITPAGQYEWRYTFGPHQAQYMLGALLLGQDGMLYGNACNGGTNQELGTVYQYDPVANTVRRLHLFDGTDGACPNSPLVQDAAGAIYGQTESGGQFEKGVVFRVMP